MMHCRPVQDAARSKNLASGTLIHHIGWMSDETKPSPTAIPGIAAERRSHASEPAPTPAAPTKPPPTEIGGPSGPEPTRFGDWERNGRCTDF